MPQLDWFALRVRSNFEALVTQALCGKGIEEYLPVCHRQFTYRGRQRKADTVLFPGYVFARFDASQRLPVVSVSGVLHIVGAGRVPIPVDPSEMAALRRMSETGLPLEPWAFTSVGRRIAIEKGPLRGLEGIVVAIKNRFRLIASVSLLQRSVAVEIEADWARPLPSPAY